MTIDQNIGRHEPAPAVVSAGRLGTFSDGVIAIAITLLVLELRLPEPGQNAWPALRAQWPSFAAYVVSFITILILWVNHHSLFHAVRYIDRTLLFLNGLVLLGISFISFPTAMLGRALTAGLPAGGGSTSGAVLYAVALGLTSASFTALWAYLAARPHLLFPEHRAGVRAALLRSLIGPALCVISALVALKNADGALIIDTTMAVYLIVPSKHVRTAAA